MLSIISTWVSCPIVRQVSHFFSVWIRVQTVKEIRREQISNASTPVPGNVNYMWKPLYKGCWSIKVCSASWSVKCKKWNRDLMAVCNFRWIWDAYLNDRERPNDLKVQPRNGDGDDVVGGVGNT